MCGIFGLCVKPGAGMPRAELDTALRRLFLLSESRGKEAAGIAVLNQASIRVHKDSTSAGQMLKSSAWRRFRAGVEPAPGQGFAAIGHARLVTNGLQAIPANNQPVVHAGSVGIHNGIIINHRALWDEIGGTPSADVDSEVIPAYVQHLRGRGHGLEDAVPRTLAALEGEASFALFFEDADILALATNTGSLFLIRPEDGSSLAFVSEFNIARQLTEGAKSIPAWRGARIEQVAPGAGRLIDLSTLASRDLGAPVNGHAVAMPALAPDLGQTRRIETRESREEERRRNLRRCTRCVLPETMPFISFDAEGVCNFCRTYRPIELKGREALEKELEKYRKPNGAADCVVAFSGGRDSSYGLHLLKTELGMNPIAYTYDWGMVTDLARRNQARICGRLGIEHIWISADIRAKRANVGRNVGAWMKKPDMGMIPLFMAGDKQFFYHANQTMKHTGIRLMGFCTNNLEKTQFKAGFAGIAPPDPSETRPHALGAADKLKMIGYYGGNFLRNPAYINRSILDTLFAYVSYYLISQDYLYLFDYLPWREEEVNRVLLGEYDWETAQDTDTTWRIGDATAPFYNYIYLSVCGFSEHDTFRSNQIREGHIDRAEALRLVERENHPRWGSIRDYLQLINIDFADAVRAIESIPKLYAEKG
jgi:asparagine synthetase B (glutamine-hydrolysing)